MKKFVSAVLTVIILSSCSKTDLVTPEQPGTSAKVFYKDANVAIADIKGEAIGSDIRLQFNSLYERDVVKMELMSGPYENMLCFIYEADIPVNSMQKKSYAVTEKGANSPARYYVIKYTLKSGGWVLTPAFKYQK